jgi:hypothetical protein
MVRHMIKNQHSAIMQFSIKPSRLKRFGQGVYKVKVVLPTNDDDMFSPKAINKFKFKYEP